MNKVDRNILIAIVTVIMLFSLVCVTYQRLKSKPILSDNVIVKNDINSTTGLDEMLNEENKATNANENTVTNTEANKVENNENKQDQKSDKQEDAEQMTTNEKKAIELAKEKWIDEWGNDKDVLFNISIQNNGKYLVTVYDTKSTKLITGYIVDVNTEIVNEK